MTLEERLEEIELRLYSLERLIIGQVLLDKRIREIENLIDHEQYDSAKRLINILNTYLGDVPELHGLRARIDVIEMLAEHPLDDETE